MSHEPIRLRDDPSGSNAMRRDLANASKHGAAARAFDVSAALAGFEAARAAQANTPSANGSNTHPRTARWWGVGAVGIATLVIALAAAWGARAWRSLHEQTVVVTSSAPHGVSANAGPSDQGAVANGAPAAADRAARSAPAEPQRNIAMNSATSSTNTAAEANTRVTHRASNAASTQPAAALAPGDDLLARDARMLTDTYAALDIDPSRALGLANAGMREFPGSARAEEREAIAVRALVALHRPAEARSRSERFLARWPSGPYAGMVRQAMYLGVRDR